MHSIVFVTHPVWSINMLCTEVLDYTVQQFFGSFYLKNSKIDLIAIKIFNSNLS